MSNLVLATGGDDAYTIARSLRFRSSASAYLNRTPASASNRKTFTWSGWIKLSLLGQYGCNFAAGDNNFCLKLAGASGTTYQFEVYDYNGGFNFQLQSTATYRDPSSWYHLVVAVDTTQATASNRVKVYVNGSQVTSFTTANYPTQNLDTYVNSTTPHYHGAFGSSYLSSGYIFDGYMTEINFIDGQALTPSSFGQTDAVTGVWTPKKYTGTYGTNGFYLNFSDNTSATTLAYDKSGNGNNWTANNISTTAGTTYDSMTDVPTLTSATAANYCVLNPLRVNGTTSLGASQKDANLTFASSSAYKTAIATIGMDSGKWYFEAHISASYNTSDSVEVGLEIAGNPATNHYIGYDPNGVTTGYGYQANTGYLVGGTSGSNDQTGGATFTTGDIIGVSYDADAGTAKWYKNNVLQYTKTGLSGQTWYFAVSAYSYGPSNIAVNFGQRPFSYTPPTGFKALNTFNLPDPTIKKPNQYMDATLYTGTGTATNVISTVNFQPDFVWIKDRQTAYDHHLFDSVRGAANSLYSNTTDAENYYSTSLASFNSNGFTITNTGNNQYYLNKSGDAFVSWNWKESATAGFDIVTYSGTGSAQNIAHNLGVAPAFIIVKGRNVGSTNWFMYHQSLGATKYIDFSTGGAGNDSTAWNNTAPTSSVFTVGSSYYTNYSGTNYVAYVWAEIPGYSKFGTYTGNYNNDGPFIYTGFKVKWLMVKNVATGATSWFLEDSVRDPYNYAYHELCPSNSNAERTTDDIWFDFLSNGFKPRNQSWGHNYNDYIYMAFAESPFKYSLAR